MTELTEKLEKVIQQAALDGALTEDAVAQFHSLVKERNALKDANVEWEETDKKHKKESQKLSERCDNMQQQILLHVERESELEEREKKMTRLEIERECADIRVKDHINMVELVFRNLEVRRNVFPVSPAAHISESGIHGMGGMIEEKSQVEKTE